MKLPDIQYELRRVLDKLPADELGMSVRFEVVDEVNRLTATAITEVLDRIEVLVSPPGGNNYNDELMNMMSKRVREEIAKIRQEVKEQP